MAKKKPKYGDAAFLEYAKKIVNHPNYSGMPDQIGERGEIQWEAPSNRQSGKFKDTHHRRREWWRQKALSIGIDPNADSTWISKTAKAIHPFGRKPCKTCGKELEIAYAYPNEHLFGRIRKLRYIDETFELSEVEHICDLLARLDERFGAKIYDDLPKLFATTSIKIPALSKTFDAWAGFLRDVYIPQEPRMLSPGAMSNPPDRFDGFHSFNRCCRSTADTGRSKENLKSYVTDRRVFEYWVDGDWVAADRLMGQVRSNPIFEQEECFNATQGGVHPKPCQADHIGPISLGFTHRPQFQLLCKTCNSGKNNRMYASDVRLLIGVEAGGEQVVSWFAKEIWDRRKSAVNDAETALRLSKLLRDNRHTYMSLLKELLDRGFYTFLASLLHLEAADFDPEFAGLKARNHLTHFDLLTKNPRTTKYATEQKARRIRIAFTSLIDYHRKENRSAFVISNHHSAAEFSAGFSKLSSFKSTTNDLDNKIAEIVGGVTVSEADLRALAKALPDALSLQENAFSSVRDNFTKGMQEVGKELDGMWNADRYVRSAPGEIIE
ncbi:Alw26I/Eco31I/Esp3I family type II restriction endonuclease [Herbaspirillum rubrisubalbicans]|uniref:Alw26I/Eco31I/Esp3I family type II restriction endonuclease n=1 Tax=Herbaspirillum rubrisubalbicans TaxID=80842 RepID=UPI00031D5FE8|nr:Alw26I/Eco31I/Esp3I family type II restriction endonuclease [Herbaspirillum rubrisubalbicans]